MFNQSENITSNVSWSRTEQLGLQFELAILSLLGTTGNALVLFVFSRTKDDSVSTIFIITLAWIDFMTCFVVIPFTMYMEHIDFYIGSDIACKFYEFLVTSHMQFSAMVMICIAVDRYVCICHPLATLFTTTNAKIVALSTALLAVLLGLFPSLGYGVYAISRSVPRHLLFELERNASLYLLPDAGNESLSNNTTATSSGSDEDHLLNRRSKDRDSSIAAFCHHLRGMLADDPEKLSSFKCPIVTVVYTGHCQPTDVLLSKSFHKTYILCYHAIFVTCLFASFVLYALTYRSVLKHRAGQHKRRSKCMEVVVIVNQQGNSCQSENKDSVVENRRQSNTWCRERIDSFFSEAAKRSYARYRANAKTAAMLFVVTLVFAVCFIPALLILSNLIAHNGSIFYLYFANNASNPIIYSFMNRNFRDNLKACLKRLRRNHRRF